MAACKEKIANWQPERLVPKMAKIFIIGVASSTYILEKLLYSDAYNINSFYYYFSKISMNLKIKLIINDTIQAKSFKKEKYKN